MSAAQTSATEPEAITYHWLATVAYDGGRARSTEMNTITAVPGQHTRASTIAAVIKHLQDKYGDIVVLFLSLEPNEL